MKSVEPETSKTCIWSLDSEPKALRTESILFKDKCTKTFIDQKWLEFDDKVNTLTGIPMSTLFIAVFNAVS